eukprot:NODE_9427_length_1425_cov_4.754237.p1 GENE.NODE_9427_length_1425_cov_4.754237~~NODE_9427_length_1425_cov_4.754237.p1  ORF type:complete len:278 (-),score=112.98 NODE_9427_length_1425_cov_4.754237:442-1275(-)
MAAMQGAPATTSSASPLEQFVLLAQGAQGRACEALVRQALDHSGVFVFGELLDCPNVQALRAVGTEGKQLVDLLEIFAYGTYPEYRARCAAGELPELPKAQRRKLQLLTVASLATREKRVAFSDLEKALEINTPRELEDLIIESVYQNLIVGRMDQESRCLVVESVFCRDCRDEDLDYIIRTLESFQGSARQMLGSLDSMVAHSRESYESEEAARKALEKVVEPMRERLSERLKDGGDPRAAGEVRWPAADDAEQESKRAKSTRGPWFGFGGALSKR